LGVLGLTGSALADTTVKATAGPVTIQGVPVEVCVVQNEAGVRQCVATPAAVLVWLEVIVHIPTPTANITPPTITRVQCPAGTQGVALQVNTGGADVTIGGTVGSVQAIPPNVSTTIAVPTTTVAGPTPQTVTVFACAGVSPGL
jgi:hypothetical protein